MRIATSRIAGASGRVDSLKAELRTHGVPPSGGSAQRAEKRHGCRALTLTELLVVIGIIGAVAAISIPALKGITKSQTINNATRQLMEDLALARQYAILNRSVVHMVFVPPYVTNIILTPLDSTTNDIALLKRLESGAFTTYAIYAERTVGDQPGRPRPRYLSPWKSLPDGVFIAEREFIVLDPDPKLEDKKWTSQAAITRPLHYAGGFSFPSITARLPQVLPHISFDAQGMILAHDANGNRYYTDEYIDLARGSVFSARSDTGDLIFFDVK